MSHRFFTSKDHLILSASVHIPMNQWREIIGTGGKPCELGWCWPLEKKARVLSNPYLNSIPLQEIASLKEELDLTLPLPDGKILRKHQQEGVRAILEKRRLILAAEMGLGKSLTSIVAAKKLSEDLNAFMVIISPVTLRDMWRSIAKMMELDKIPEICSWSNIRWPEKADFILIADEASHSQGGSKTQRGKAFLDITSAPNCVACILLTGTPMKNGRPSNLYPLLRAVKAPVAKSKSWYEQHFCDAKRTRWSRWDITGCSNLDELRTATKPYILRHLKRDCLDLPKMTRVMVHAEVDASHATLYKQSCQSARTGWLTSKKTSIDAKGFVDKTYQAASLAKVPYAIELIEDILEQGHKVVVFSQYLEPVHQVARAFEKRALVLTGDTPITARQGLVDRFQSDPSIRVWVSTAQTGGLGLTLTAACYVILIDRPWTPGDTEQCEARIDRDGQKLPCTSYWLQYGDVDEVRDDKLALKSINIKEALGDQTVGIDFTSEYESLSFKQIADKIK